MKKLLLLLLSGIPLITNTMEQTASPTFTFNRLQASDLPLLFKWFQQPYIADLWKEITEYVAFKEKYINRYIESSTLHLK